MRLTQPIMLGKGVLASIFSDKSQPLNITPNLSEESPRSTGDTPKPLYKVLWPRIYDHASKIKTYKVIGSSIP
jgi:hypothetical protein